MSRASVATPITDSRIRGALTQQTIGLKLLPIHAKETAAGLVAADLNQYEPYGDLRRYKPTLDGVADDTVAVSNWIDVGLQGMPLAHLLGNAKCATWTQKSIATDLFVIGFGGGKITGTSAVDFIKPAGGVIDIRGVEFDTWLSLIKNDDADTGTTPLLRLRDCVIRNCSANGIDHERPIDKFEMHGVRMFGMSNYAVRCGQNDFTKQDNWKNYVFSDIYIADSTAELAVDAAGILLYGKHLQMNNIHIGTITSVTGASWGVYTKCRYSQISNVLIESVVTTSATDVTGLNIKGALKGVTTNPQGFNHVISNVTVLNTDGIGFKVQQQDVLATNIIVEEFGIDGITIDDKDASNVIVNGFKVLTATAGTKVGVRVSNDAGGIKICNGLIDGPQVGVRVNAVSGGGVGYVYDSIHIDNGTNGFQFNTSAAIDQVKIRDIYTGSGVTNGFVTTGAGVITNLRVIDCDFSDATSPTSIGGTLTAPQFRNVGGYRTRNFGSASVASGATIAHGLASTPDFISVIGGTAGVTDPVATSPTTTTFVVTFGGGGTKTIYFEAAMTEAAEAA